MDLTNERKTSEWCPEQSRRAAASSTIVVTRSLSWLIRARATLSSLCAPCRLSSVEAIFFFPCAISSWSDFRVSAFTLSSSSRDAVWRRICDKNADGRNRDSDYGRELLMCFPLLAIKKNLLFIAKKKKKSVHWMHWHRIQCTSIANVFIDDCDVSHIQRSIVLCYNHWRQFITQV